jgi:hypothetical protein
VRVCTVDPEEEPPAPVPCNKLDIVSCGAPVLSLLSLSTSARTVRIGFHDEPIDLTLFQHHEALEVLTASSPIVYGLRHLRGAIRELNLGMVDFARDVRDALPRFAGTLETLGLTSVDPFAPADLPELPRLRLFSLRRSRSSAKNGSSSP